MVTRERSIMPHPREVSSAWTREMHFFLQCRLDQQSPIARDTEWRRLQSSVLEDMCWQRWNMFRSNGVIPYSLEATLRLTPVSGRRTIVSLNCLLGTHKNFQNVCVTWRPHGHINTHLPNCTASHTRKQSLYDYVRFEVFTAVNMKNAALWAAMPCGSCKNRLFEGT
jgi:hypothetical protein